MISKIHSKWIVAALIFTASLHGHAQTQNFETNSFVETIAGSGFYGYLDGHGLQTMFNRPNALAVDDATNIFVWDSFNFRIRKISADYTVTTFAGSGSYGFQNGQGTNASFGEVNSMAIDSDGNIYASDRGCIRKITSSGLVSIFTGNPNDQRYLDEDLTNARFGGVLFLALDRSGQVYVSDSDNYRVRKISTNGIVTTFAGSGNSGSQDGTGIFSSFVNPRNIAVDPVGNVFVADAYRTIRTITPEGVVTTIAGLVQGAYRDGQGTNTGFWSIGGFASDRLGNLYVSDADAVRKTTPEVVVTTLAGQFPSSGFMDGEGFNAKFNGPHGLGLDRSGRIYIADTINHRIRRI